MTSSPETPVIPEKVHLSVFSKKWWCGLLKIHPYTAVDIEMDRIEDDDTILSDLSRPSKCNTLVCIYQRARNIDWQNLFSMFGMIVALVTIYCFIMGFELWTIYWSGENIKNIHSLSAKKTCKEDIDIIYSFLKQAVSYSIISMITLKTGIIIYFIDFSHIGRVLDKKAPTVSTCEAVPPEIITTTKEINTIMQINLWVSLGILFILWITLKSK